MNFTRFKNRFFILIFMAILVFPWIAGGTVHIFSKNTYEKLSVVETEKRKLSKIEWTNLLNTGESISNYVDDRIIKIMQELVDDYNNEKNGDLKKEKRLRMLYNNPCGFRLTARMTTNYRQLKTMYQQRKNHRLPEWRQFCEWIKNLPYSELITGEAV